jgi:hypothetical protein
VRRVLNLRDRATTALSHTRFEPSGWTGNEELGYAKSIMDYLFRWMAGEFPYVFLDGLWLKRSWGGEVKNVSVLEPTLLQLTQETVSEGAKEDKARVVGAFPDGKSALMLVAARLRYVAATRWGTKRYLQMNRLAEVVAIA